MSLAVASGVAPSIVLFTVTTGIAAVASVMLTLFVLVIVAFAVAPLVSSTWIGQQDVSSTTGPRTEPSDD
ncbi:hypothetical protein [Natrinema longum]|uniref:Uncharacterized protein n=1 Tax=Natrinema longum TaxID=370324 RepID=A0A8A2U9D9_9EURY|nr:hypothetical protein [Natrinema longum]MBZ6493450.1 hypothetical protein [Natrinema longum]QSW85203.1 hypothetical protein J0X27_17440 [Natrinema longum]